MRRYIGYAMSIGVAVFLWIANTTAFLVYTLLIITASFLRGATVKEVGVRH